MKPAVVNDIQGYISTLFYSNFNPTSGGPLGVGVKQARSVQNVSAERSMSISEQSRGAFGGGARGNRTPHRTAGHGGAGQPSRGPHR